jgi:uncharacterized Zn finger protein (UPF0148 family)
MSTGVFSLMCPRCGGDLRTGKQGVEACAACGTEYVERFGYLFQRTVAVADAGVITSAASEASPN